MGEVTSEGIVSLLIAAHLEPSADGVEAITKVSETFRLLVWTVGLVRKVIHHALAVAAGFLRPESPGGDAADDGVEVVPFGLNVV